MPRRSRSPSRTPQHPRYKRNSRNELSQSAENITDSQVNSSEENIPMNPDKIYINNLIERLKRTDYDLNDIDIDQLNNYLLKYTQDSDGNIVDEEMNTKILSVFANSSPIAKLLYESFIGEKEAKESAWKKLGLRLTGQGKKKKTIRKKSGKKKTQKKYKKKNLKKKK